MRFLPAALIALLLALPCAWAEDGPTPADIAKEKAASVSAQGLVDLFAQSCLAHAGKLPRLRLWLDLHARQASEPQTAYFLAGPKGAMPGKVWLQQSKTGNYAIVVSDAAGLCSVKAEKGKISEVAADLMQAAPKLNLALKPTGDEAAGSFMGMAGRVITYTMPVVAEEYKVVLIGSDKPGAALQSQLNLVMPGKEP